MNPEVQLEDLKEAWLALGERLQKQSALDLAKANDRRARSVVRRLRPLLLGQVVQTVVAVVLIVWSAVFWVEHRSDTHLMLAGVIMEAYGVIVLIAGARTLTLVGNIDYSVPVVDIDTTFARLRRWYRRSGMVVGLPWWLLWMPFMTMLFMSLFGVDMVSESPSVIWMGTIVGVVGLAATWAFHRWAYSPDRPRIARRMADSTAGRSIVRAQVIIDQLTTDNDEPED